jgi:hypothetical protein
MILFGAIAVLMMVIAAVLIIVAWYGKNDAVCATCGWHVPDGSARGLRQTRTACPKCDAVDWI